MDTPSTDIYQARSEGFITRTRVNNPTSTSDEKYQLTLDTGTNIVTFDQEYAYTWSLLERDPRCEILDPRMYGKVCKWTPESTFVPYIADEK